ncbi:MAG: hypothetical protein M3R25_11500, partial [Bacteroidota bacterium]|nr:hypothetical protein [Bacteroidota bacterium]
VYSGTCDNLVQLGCNAYGESTIKGLTGGETYYLRIQSASLNREGSFELCIRAIIDLATNDECQDATAFPAIPTNGDWVGLDGDTSFGSDSGIPGCDGYANDDIWFSFVVPDGVTDIMFRYDWDPYQVVELFEGPCDSLISSRCG